MLNEILMKSLSDLSNVQNLFFLWFLFASDSLRLLDYVLTLRNLFSSSSFSHQNKKNTRSQMNLRAGRQMVENKNIINDCWYFDCSRVGSHQVFRSMTILFYRHLIGAEAGSFKPVSCSWWFISFNDPTEKRVPCFFISLLPISGCMPTW